MNNNTYIIEMRLSYSRVEVALDPGENNVDIQEPKLM